MPYYFLSLFLLLSLSVFGQSKQEILGRVMPTAQTPQVGGLPLTIHTEDKKIEVQTQADGSFSFEIGTDTKAVFKSFAVKGFNVPLQKISYSNKDGKTFISFAAPTIYRYGFVFKDEKNNPLENIKIILDGDKYETRSKGLLSIESEEKINPKVEVPDFEIIRQERNNEFSFTYILKGKAIGSKKTIRGVVMNTNRAAVSNLRINFSNTRPQTVITTSDGTFVVETQDQYPTVINLSKDLIIKDISYPEGGKGMLRILVANAYVINGIINYKNSLIPNVKIEVIDGAEAISDQQGKFTLKLPDDFIPKKAVFRLAGKDLSPTDYVWKDNFRYLIINKPLIEQKYEIAFFDESDKAIRQIIHFNWENNAQSNAAGVAQIKSFLDEDEILNTELKAKGFDVINIKKIKTNSFKVQLYAKPLPTAPSKEVANLNPQTPPIPQDTLETPQDEINQQEKTIGDEVNLIVQQLEMEKQELSANRFKIEEELRKIREKLNADISPEEHTELQTQLEKLENALIENSIAYENAQNRTHNLVDSIRNIVYQRGILEQRLDQVSRMAKQQAIIFALISGLLLTLIWIIFRSKKRSQEQNKKLKEANRLIEEKNAILNVQKEEIFAQAENLKSANRTILEKQHILEEQSLEIQEKNNNIIASISYASRIQQALLPTKTAIEQQIPNIFILYKPRDIVSGDFYWFAERNNQILITAADCTGHGVPGALMSMIGMEQLNEIVNIHKIMQPAEVLHRLDEGIKKHLKQNENQVRDGMDISILLLDKNKSEVYFAGAKNPVVYVQNGQLNEIKGTVKAVGGRDLRSDLAFEQQKIVLNQESIMFYLMSDGYEDQFGGKRNKKFMKKNLRELFLEIHSKNPDEQEQILDQRIENWKNGREQTDDILVLGFRW